MISKTLGSDENYHELMDVVGSLINPEIHEKCMHSTGDVIIWLGAWMWIHTVNVKQVVLNVLLWAGYTDETVEDVWASAQPPYDPVPFEGIDADLSHRF